MDKAAPSKTTPRLLPRHRPSATSERSSHPYWCRNHLFFLHFRVQV